MLKTLPVGKMSMNPLKITFWRAVWQPIMHALFDKQIKTKCLTHPGAPLLKNNKRQLGLPAGDSVQL